MNDDESHHKRVRGGAAKQEEKNRQISKLISLFPKQEGNMFDFC
jgi:hypothetical protein